MFLCTISFFEENNNFKVFNIWWIHLFLETGLLLLRSIHSGSQHYKLPTEEYTQGVQTRTVHARLIPSLLNQYYSVMSIFSEITLFGSSNTVSTCSQLSYSLSCPASSGSGPLSQQCVSSPRPRHDLLGCHLYRTSNSKIKLYSFPSSSVQSERKRSIYLPRYYMAIQGQGSISPGR